LTAEERIRRIKKAIRGKKSYNSYTEHTMMKVYSVSYQQLMDFPYERYLEFAKIISLEAKEEKKKNEEMKREADRRT